MNTISAIGIDLAKSSFAICGLNKDGEVVLRKMMSRRELIEWSAKISTCVIGIEACGGGHYWGRLFLSQGHQVKMMSARAVKPFAPPQKKNDASDAQAIAVAATQASVRSIRIKEKKAQDLDVLRGLRDQYLKSRVALVNQAHGFCLEFGVALPKSKTAKGLNRYFAAIEDGENNLTDVARSVVLELLNEAKELDQKAKAIERKLESILETYPVYEKLVSVPGIGVQSAAAILSFTGGDVSSYKNGRQFAANLGLVPRQHSTGGKTRLLGINKSGSADLRRLLVVGVRSVLNLAAKRTDQRNQWIEQKRKAKGFMKANIALANKTARTVYAVLKKDEFYKASA